MTRRECQQQSLDLPRWGAAQMVRERAELARMRLWRLRLYGVGVAVLFGVTHILCGLVTLCFGRRDYPYEYPYAGGGE